MRRRLLLLFLALIVGLVVVVATVPWWLGAAMRGFGESRGLTVGRYERIGYSRFALHDAEFRQRNVRVIIKRAEAETPLLWWWHHWQRQPDLIVAGDWRVEVERSDAPSAPAGDRGWLRLRTQLQRIAAVLDRWLPRAKTGAGLVRWPGGELSLASADWANRELKVEDFVFRSLKLDVSAAFPSDDQIKIRARLDDGSATAVLDHQGPSITGNVTWWDQPATITATFGPTGWLPAEALVHAPAWNLPGSRLKLGDAYSTVRGATRVEWRADHILADITAAGEPVPGKSVPPLELALRGQGDMQAFTVELLNATLPGVTARLTEPVTVERTGRIRESAARFALNADLVKLPWVTATGAVSGEARLVSGVSASPVVEFAVTAKDVKAQDVALSEAGARGRFAWPRLEVSEGSMLGGAGDRLTWRGGWDFRAKEVLAANVSGEVRRASIARWLPKQPGFEVVQIKAQAAGPLATVNHSGNISAAGVHVEGLHPLAVALDWRGEGMKVDEFKAQANAGDARVALGGQGDLAGVTLRQLDFVQGDAPRLQLSGPTQIRWKPQLQIETLRLAGPEGNLSVALAWGQTGRVEVAAHQLSSKWLHDLLIKPGPPITVTLLALVGSWDRGPMSFSLTGGATLEIGEGRTAATNLAARGDKEGVQIEALRALEGDVAVINATGRLPVTFTPGGGTLMKMNETGPLVLDANVAPNSAFWQKLADMSGVELQEPRASARVAGTWRRPEGEISLQARRIAVDPKRFTRPLPTITALDVQVTGGRDAVTLSRFTVRVEEQVVRAQGRLPVGEGEWSALFKDPLAAARRGADLRVELPDADVAVFTRFLPAVLAPKGRLQADLQYKSGGLEGFLRLRDAATRPLGPLGVLQEVSADIAMSGRKFALRGVTAKSGGQPVTLSGTIELPDSGAPRFDLSLVGENLPFVRQTGLLLRGDLDLKLQTPAGAQPRLSGNVRLRDSLFLSDVRAFLPKGGASPTRRPPYFAIETVPVNTWSLAVDVVGEEFLRVRTPVFTGVASAHFRLGGTLGEPRAIGEIQINEGNVRMPFASFSVQQGSVRLTEADPYEPTVYLRGTGRRYGYDLTMEIDGNATQPNVVFTSSPPLDSEQVLLMVMTGTAPSNEISKTATQRVANIGLFLSQSLLSSLGSDAAEADRLTFASGEKISRQGKETYDIEYKLSDRWTVTGEYNEFDEYNAGLKWRVFPRAKEKPASQNAKK